MNNYFHRGGAPVPASPGMQQPRVARSAALLIDFDNVTLGVHTDLGRELKTLINSEVFRGKIAVRRAYADWRRYPNYVVPLTEASIDLIFAPAYGSSKKNTTDLRMSADAIELAFTRPEIDTFILLTGDSDFSSTVMKLKEYGKYVIGVGMRESSSDLIIQNCDEYFSYHALTGLTRTTAGEGMKEDPWELAIRAAQRMASSGDAMRTDRLKQVMLSIDPGFNEKELGYSKFSRFVAELEKKGLVRLQKLPDGQYEILVDGRSSPAAAQPESDETGAQPRESRGPRDGRRDRRGRRREGGEPEPRPPRVETAAEEPAQPAEAAGDPGVAAPSAKEPPPVPVAPAATVGPVEGAGPDEPMREGLALLQQAVRELAPKRSESARDGDVKRRMMELEGDFDEATLGFSKFSRFLRAAHDAEAIDLQRLDNGSYEVTLGTRKFQRTGATEESSRLVAAPASAERAAERGAEPVAAGSPEPPSAVAQPVQVATEPTRTVRGRRRGRGGLAADAGTPPILPGQVVRTGREQERRDAAPAASAPEKRERQDAAAAAAPEAQLSGAPERSAGEATTEGAKAEAEATPTPTARRRGRRGRRDPGDSGAPELLPEQVVSAPRTEEPKPEKGAQPTEAEADTPAPRKRRARGRGRKPKAAEPDVAVGSVPAFSAESLGLPSSPPEIASYITRSYKGVGKRTADSLLDAFGTDVFRVLAEEPQRVQEVLGDRRADAVLSRWRDDFAARAPAPAGPPEPASGVTEEPSGQPTGPAPAVEAGPPPVVDEADDDAAAAPRKRRRGSRSRKSKSDPAAPAADVPSSPSEAPATQVEARKAAAAAEPEGGGKPARGSRAKTGGKGRGGRRKAEPTNA
jgi:uncharacterized protein (TIGR00288 family)